MLVQLCSCEHSQKNLYDGARVSAKTRQDPTISFYTIGLGGLDACIVCKTTGSGVSCRDGREDGDDYDKEFSLLRGLYDPYMFTRWSK